MYHTFQVGSAAGNSDTENSGKANRPGNPKRISTTNACIECRRRKIRCDGLHPCGPCQWYQNPELCAYSKPTQRNIPSKKLVDRLQGQVDQLSSICSRLFPGRSLEELAVLPREDLINLALTIPTPTSSTPPNALDVPFLTEQSEGAESLDALDQAPDHDPVVDEAKRHRDKVQGISDDVNGLSLSDDRPTSYVGVSSISAALKVIFKTTPIARPLIAQTYTETALPSRCNTPPLPVAQATDPAYLPPADVGSKLIESYFAHVHALMPMIDEDQFWHTYLYGERTDSPWLALLNMVIALGSLASSTCDNDGHIAYFQRARRHLDMETFGSGNLLVLQALGLLSGYYLHWLNRPNEANSLMGAALRMATALGLHREYNDAISAKPAGPRLNQLRGSEVPVEVRRRTWWSLFCLDTWASMTTGRPSLGRMGPGVTVQSPSIPLQMNNAQYLASLKLLPIVHNIAFCKLATRIQDKLSGQPLLKHDELLALDMELIQWHDDLPPILRDVVPPSTGRGPGASPIGKPATNASSLITPKLVHSANTTVDFAQPPERDHATCPEVLKTPRAIMHWWYMTLRMLMHRPYLLATALRRTSYSNLSTEEKVAVSKCRIIAGQLISDIDATCEADLIAGWNAVWIMYQAVMVPLVSLFSSLSSPSAAKRNPDTPTSPGSVTTSDDVERWRDQIQLAMAFFDRMSRFSVAAKKSKDVIRRLFEASKHIDALQRQTQGAQASPETFTGPTASHRVAVGVQSNNAAQISAGANLPDTWGLSPGRTAAMNSYWDDMMWDTFPAMPDADQSTTANLFPGLDDLDWQALAGGSAGGMSGEVPWPAWPYEGPPQAE